MKKIDDDLALDEEQLRFAQPIRRQFEQEQIVMSYLRSPNPQDHAKIDQIENDPEVQKEVREMIGLCRLKLARMDERHGSFVPYVVPAYEDMLSATAD